MSENNSTEIENKRNDENTNEIIITYSINEWKLRLFNITFVKNNQDKCHIIYDNKKYELVEMFDDLKIDINKDIKKLQIILRGINNITNMGHMFGDCVNLLSVSNFENLDIKKVNNLQYLFYESLKTIPDISNWDISNVTDISGIFYGCNSLTSVPDISKWNTQNVTNISYLFCNCSSLLSIPDISNWNTDNVTNISYLFYNCSSLLNLPDISKWNTSNVKKMDFVFGGCGSLSLLPDISKWKTDNVEVMK